MENAEISSISIERVETPIDACDKRAWRRFTHIGGSLRAFRMVVRRDSARHARHKKAGSPKLHQPRASGVMSYRRRWIAAWTVSGLGTPWQ